MALDYGIELWGYNGSEEYVMKISVDNVYMSHP